MSETVTVHCHVPGGLVLQVTEASTDEFGVKVRRRIGEAVTLLQGDNHGIDAAFMDAWTKQYAATALVNYVSVRPVETA